MLYINKSISNMMRSLKSIKPIKVIIIAFSAFYFPLHAQWTWVNGSYMPNSPMNLGTTGVFNPSTNPGAVYAADRWNDKQGNIWILDKGLLWKYDTKLHMWAMIKGNPGNPTPVYGIKGVSSPLNNPGLGTCNGHTWTDLNGDMWILSVGVNDCLWKYIVSKNEWVWMAGTPNPSGLPDPVYGTLNVPSPNNTPGYRNEGNLTWTDQKGNLWLIGGGESSVWMFDVSVMQWAWKGGDNGTASGTVYGAKGVPSKNNRPQIEGYGLWIDKSENVYFYTNVMWKYNPSTSEFTWLSGDTSKTSTGNYGLQCIPSVNNYPPPRGENRYAITDYCGNFWLFGGSIYRNNAIESFNDLWKYNPITNEWTWVSGDKGTNGSSSFGQLGVSDPSNTPPVKGGGIAGLNKGLITGLGKAGFSDYNDMWIYAPHPKPDFIWNQNSGKCYTVSFTDNSKAECGGDIHSWKWDFGDGAISSAQHPVHDYTHAGDYNVTLIVGNCFDIADTIRKKISVVPNIAANISTTPCGCEAPDGTAQVNISSPGNYTFSWNPPVSNSNQASLLNAGTYTVTITNLSDNNCKSDKVFTISKAMPPVLKADSIFPALCQNLGKSVIHATAGTPPYIYYWLPSGPANNVAALASGNHIITVKDAKNCKDSLTVKIPYTEVPEDSVLLQIPNIFTPNNDQVNDRFQPHILKGVEEVEVTIHNRWGTCIYTEKGSSFSWDGKDSGGTILNPGVYFYTITFTDVCNRKSVKKGCIHIEP